MFDNETSHNESTEVEARTRRALSECMSVLTPDFFPVADSSRTVVSVTTGSGSTYTVDVREAGLLLEAGVLPSVVMEFGGWEDWQIFREHYLAEFSPEALRREREKIPWLAECSGDKSESQGYAMSQYSGSSTTF